MRWIVFLLLLPQLAVAATISGTVYDLGLDEIQDAIITIDTSPEQRMVVKDAGYSFSVPEGMYTLHAVALVEGENWVVDESITVLQDGSYILDLILMPDFGVEDDLLFEEEHPDLTEDESNLLTIVLILIGVVAIVGISFFYGKKMSVHAAKDIIQDDEFRKAVLSILKKHKGRITQRDLRKEMPFSEAKVSLVLTELEAEGKIKKIKKGRGNVIVKV